MIFKSIKFHPRSEGENNKTSVTSRRVKVPSKELENVKLLATLDILNPRPQEGVNKILSSKFKQPKFNPCDSLVVLHWLLSQLLDVPACLTGSHQSYFPSTYLARTLPAMVGSTSSSLTMTLPWIVGVPYCLQ
ncbi:hypothetical protein M9H77_23446 [Catharanthus roseus]|uniref:Uncharacterized protein n=1 Tax=Catharanthus roseus TaxID=4058 RepID=A0ACC0AT10_CATRO|nr:hypothetical protein M9H77_23446 [Catharanthus roseus]